MSDKSARQKGARTAVTVCQQRGVRQQHFLLELQTNFREETPNFAFEALFSTECLAELLRNKNYKMSPPTRDIQDLYYLDTR